MTLPRLLAAALLCCCPALAMAKWPKRLFAPYLYLGTGDHFRMTACDDAIGLKHYTLAFVIAGGDGQPAWYGRVPMKDGLYADEVDAIRKRGGDVLCSFGGADGTELAIAITDPAKLEAAYQSVIDRYRFTWLDFDVEGDNLTKHADANTRRNAVLARLQKKNPGLRVSYTLPADANGIGDVSRGVLADAKAQGVTVYSANIMVMFFGKDEIGHGKSEAELGIDAANATHAQLQKTDPATLISLCPCIGTNGSRAELFTPKDAAVLRAFADRTPWVCGLTYWSIDRDSMAGRGPDTTSEIDQTPFEFAKAFMGFTAR